MVIYNQIFESFREKQKQINEAIDLLEDNGFVVYNKEKRYAADRKVYSNQQG